MPEGLAASIDLRDSGRRACDRRYAREHQDDAAPGVPREGDRTSRRCSTRGFGWTQVRAHRCAPTRASSIPGTPRVFPWIQVPSTVKAYTSQNLRFLCAMGVKAVVAATRPATPCRTPRRFVSPRRSSAQEPRRPLCALQRTHRCPWHEATVPSGAYERAIGSPGREPASLSGVPPVLCRWRGRYRQRHTGTPWRPCTGNLCSLAGSTPSSWVARTTRRSPRRFGRSGPCAADRLCLVVSRSLSFAASALSNIRTRCLPST
jgi:hypothetical protein